MNKNGKTRHFVKNLAKHKAQLNPPAAPAAISEMARQLKCELPAEMVSLYELHDGMSERGLLPFRLLSIAEVIQTHHEILDTQQDYDFPPEARAFWTDGGGNYAALFVEGDFRNNLCFFDHEEPDFSPRFLGLASFLRSQLDAAKRKLEWREMATDFPVGLGGRPETGGHGKSLELQILLQGLAVTRDLVKRRKIAFNVMSLWPANDDSLLIRLLDDQDIYVQERSAEILGKRRCVRAIPKLIEVVRRDHGRVINARVASLLAIGRMKTPETVQTLLRLKDELPEGLKTYVVSTSVRSWRGAKGV